ncbi:hypothetical protein [Nocardioides sp. zg-DK7169]|uniref:hypothetical protein n=1 Tax=Nocardioides sp. zg-DK7169 TaxID=2736600 RepID=UPI001552BA26|nr:hypothetical protein [Nocardioides sp. zg-DK7169]NPC96733.1 hypothetical protein [Nocardioides sp. zg-DK7169]
MVDQAAEHTDARAGSGIRWRRIAIASAVIAVAVTVTQLLLVALTDDSSGKELPVLAVHPSEAVMTLVGVPLGLFVSVFVILTVVNWFRLRPRR